MKVHDYEKLIVWQKSIELVYQIYEVSSRFPKEEQYGLTSQMRRSAVSIPSNIAEGSRRGTKKDFCNFLRNSMGSASELETQTTIAKGLKFITQEIFFKIKEQIAEILRMLNRLIEVYSKV